MTVDAFRAAAEASLADLEIATEHLDAALDRSAATAYVSLRDSTLGDDLAGLTDLLGRLLSRWRKALAIEET